jgi:hypothetical protein
MKDLYARLKIGPSASEEEILRATSDPSRGTARDRRDAKAVLLVPARRRQYDRIREVASTVGRLRATLGMPPGTRRHPDVYEDFARPFPRPQAWSGDSSQPNPSASKQSSVGSAGQSESSSAVGLFWSLLILGLIVFAASRGGSSQSAQQARSAAIAAADAAAAAAEPTPKPPALPPRTAAPRPSAPVADIPPAPRQQLVPPRASTTPRPPTAPAFNSPVQPLPPTGSFDSSFSSTQNAIIVKTRAGKHTLVKIENLAGLEITRGFIRGGDTYQFDLRQGTYVIKMAWGEQWYGDIHLFGPRTQYSKADDTFPLRQRGEQWTVELIPQTSGNLREVNLRPEQF